MSAYEEREKTDMVLFLFNLFAVFNYVSMFVAMTLSTGTYSGLYILVHYILIFVNYVLWNVYIAKKINSQKEKQFLISLSVVQIFTVVGFILSVLGVLPFFDITYSDIISYLTSNTSDVLRNSLFFLSIFHITIMIFWVSKKYKIRQTENLSPITSQGMTQSKNKNKVNAK